MIIRKRIYQVLEIDKGNDKLSHAFDIAIISLVIINVIALVIETIPSMSKYSNYFFYFEVFSVSVFTIEYILRVYSCTEDIRYSNSLRGRIKFIFTPLLLIDLIAILPFYFYTLGIDARFLRLIRIFRIFRLFKLARYVQSLSIISGVLSRKIPDIVISIMMIMIMLIISSSIMFLAEHEAQPEVFSSIPATMWWAVATLTTVGYGDIYPITAVGKLLGSIIAILGIAAIAIPTGILASAFATIANRKDQ